MIETLLVARKVRVGNVPGIVGVKAGHLQRPDEQRTVPPIRDLYIDVGYDTAAEVAALGIHTGTPITYDAPLSELTNGDRVYGKAVDNRISCAILLQLLERLQGTTLNGTLTCAVAVQEEVGLRGAQVLAYRLNPDYIIVIDTMPSGDTPEMRMAQDANVRIGAGPVIRLMSGGGGGGGHHMPPQMVRLMLDTAEVRRYSRCSPSCSPVRTPTPRRCTSSARASRPASSTCPAATRTPRSKCSTSTTRHTPCCSPKQSPRASARTGWSFWIEP